MQLKGLVRFFAIALILICLYQLSFTWFVRGHEKAMDEKAQAWMKRISCAHGATIGQQPFQPVDRTAFRLTL